MTVEIIEPSDAPAVTILTKHSKILVWCDCDVTFNCPQGKRGSQTRCQVWKEKSHITKAGVQSTIETNRNTR